MNPLRSLLGFISFVYIAGCIPVFTAPEDNKPFTELTDITQLIGTYRNRGDPKGFLSHILWGASVNAAQISEIEVLVTENQSLSVRAWSAEHTLIKEQTFTAGKDFELQHGRLVLRCSLGLIDGRSGVAGVMYENVTLGLDTDQQGKYRAAGGLAGLGYMIIPIGALGRVDMRFARIR